MTETNRQTEASSDEREGEVHRYAICSLAELPSQRARGFVLARDDGAGGKPWPIVIVRWGRRVFGYVNRCPHHASQLDWEPGQFFDPGNTRLMCGKHGSLFDLATGDCLEGPCKGDRLERIDVDVIDGDICVRGVKLVEDDEDRGDGADPA